MSIPTGMGDARDLLRPTLGVAAGLVLDRAAGQWSVLTSQLVHPGTVSLSTRSVTRSATDSLGTGRSVPRAAPPAMRAVPFTLGLQETAASHSEWRHGGTA
jgi:hypothetical protein